MCTNQLFSVLLLLQYSEIRRVAVPPACINLLLIFSWLILTTNKHNSSELLCKEEESEVNNHGKCESPLFKAKLSN